MRFSYSKAAILKPQKEKSLSTFLIALLVAASFLVPYMVMSQGYFIFYGDFNVQQIPFYQQCHEAIREGNIFWSSTTDLGANFIGSYSFYLLGSPFFWLTLPFPNEILPYLMGPLLILKFACAAFTAYFYIRRFTRTPEAARLGAILYAFSGFSVYNIFFNHFHEAIIIFPLLLLAVELLLTENRRFGFAVTVCACAVINYYFFFGMVVFTVIYFFVRLFSGAIKVKFSRFLAFAFEAVLGLGLSCALLLPSLLAIIDNSRISSLLTGWSGLMYGKEQIYANILQCFFFPPDIPARAVFFPGAEVNWSSLGGWLPIFSTVGLFTWFSQRKKTWVKTLLGICILMALVPILNSAFSAFNTAYYARWFYMPILIMCMATVSLTEDSKVNWTPSYKWVLGITIAVSLVIGLFPKEDAEGKITFGVFTNGSSDEEFIMYLCRYWGACLIAVVSLIILGFILKMVKNNRKAFLRTALACVCIMTTLYGNVFVGSGYSHSYDVDKVVINQLIRGKVDLGDSDGFRIDVYGGPDNVAMFLGYSGINAFHSIVPASIFDYYDYIGQERIVGSRPTTSAYATRSLLSVKYLLNSKHLESFVDDNGDTLMLGYKYVKTESDYYVYENENYIPYGFSYEYYMTEEFCQNYEPSERDELLLKAILLTDEQVKKYGYMLKDISKDNSISYISEGEGTSLLRTYENMQYDCKKLAETASRNFKFDNHGFSATVTRDKENLVFFSIPYDKGWTATVNGKKAEIEKVNKGFMAVKVGKGESEIRFDYMTPGLMDGVAITAVSAAVFLIYIIIFLLWNIKHKKDTPYPEGEKLLKQWHSEEREEIRLEAEQKAWENKPSLLDTPSDFSSLQANSDFEDGFKIDTDSLEQEDK